MALQKEVLRNLVPGVVGEFSDDSPRSARAYVTFGKGGKVGTDLPEFGKFFSFARENITPGTSAKSDVAKQGATASTWTMGILVNPKEHYTIGFHAKRTLPVNGQSATIATRGHIWVPAKTKTRAGAYVYVDADGNLGDSTLANGNGVKVLGATWLRTVALASGKTEVISEVAIDNPAINGMSGSESVESV